MALYFISGLLLVISILARDPLLVNISLLTLLGTYLYKQISSSDIQNKINPIIFFCLGKSVSTLGNLLGVYYQYDNVEKWKYWYYANELYMFEAALINHLGSSCLIIGYIIFSRNSKANFLPRITFSLSSDWVKKNDRTIWIIILIIISNIITLPIPDRLVNLLLNLFIFLYAYLSQTNEEDAKYFFIRGYLLVIVLTINAYMHSYLRVESINPSVLFLMGLFWGAGNLSFIRNLNLAPILMFLVLFGISFSELGGENRLNVQSKNEILAKNFFNLFSEESEEEDVTTLDYTSGDKSILGRMSNFNQLTKVVEVQQEFGFLNGETLGYLAYAWIPRVIWPDKPTIATGKWFAVKAGLAYVHDNGDINNSVDMTPAGELYINFGYTGLIIGSILLGIFWAILWRTTNVFQGLNITGMMFGAYLLNLGYWQLGADLQIIISALSMYCLCFIISKVLNMATSK